MGRSQRSRYGRAAALVLAAAAALTTTESLPADAYSGAVPRPDLAGHTFISTNLIPEPFVATYIRSTLGYASAMDIEYPPILVSGDTLRSGLEGNLAYSIIDFEFQYAVKEWIAMRFGVDLRGRLGTEFAGLVAEGVTVGAGTDFGWLVRVFESGNTALSGSLGITNRTFTRVDIRQFVEDVVNEVPDPRLIDDVPTLRGQFGGRFAWAVSRPFGVMVLAEGSYGETPWRSAEEDGFEYTYGASVDFDANPVWSVPVGAAFAFRQTSLPELSSRTSALSRTTVLRLAYTGQPDFLIGLDVVNAFNRENQRDDSIHVAGAMLELRYYFH